MVKDTTATGDDKYKEYLLINNECIENRQTKDVHKEYCLYFRRGGVIVIQKHTMKQRL